MGSQDFQKDNDGDLLMKNGDFVIDNSDAQNVGDILIAYPGWWKQFPQLGVGIMDYLESSGKEQELVNKVYINLQSDGFTLNKPIVFFGADGKLNINPNAVRQ